MVSDRKQGSPVDSRQLMERAVEIMRESVAEQREDGKASPRVGAVLLKPNGTLDTACRGELRDGDHAEFTLLERKNRDSRLDGSVLFSTLEPCAPGARRSPKLSCAERIVLARIKEVWVGITDPDPTVDRKGIKYLQDHGVTVHLFDRDLQDIIRAANVEFIEQALERAALPQREAKPRTVILSSMEGVADDTDVADLSIEALERYRIAAGIRVSLASDAFKLRLSQQGLLKHVGKSRTWIPTGFGALLFGTEPRLVMPQAGLLATIHYSDGREELMDFDGPMVLIPDRLESWLADKLPNVIDRSAMVRRRLPPVPFEMVREAVVNALVHRDYEIRGAKCQLVVTSDSITVMSPGKPVDPIRVDQLRTFSAPMLSRNPELHFVFAKMGFAEERGFGIGSLKKRAVQLGLPLPRYTWEDPYVVLTIFRSVEGVTGALAPDVRESLSSSEREGLEWMSRVGKTSSRHYAEELQVDERTARRHLSRFVSLGLARKVGSGPSTEYEVV